MTIDDLIVYQRVHKPRDFPRLEKNWKTNWILGTLLKRDKYNLRSKSFYYSEVMLLVELERDQIRDYLYGGLAI